MRLLTDNVASGHTSSIDAGQPLRPGIREHARFGRGFGWISLMAQWPIVYPALSQAET